MGTQTRNIVIGGEAGQGLVTVGTMLSKALVRHGYHIVVTQGYQSRIRGGHNTFAIRVGNGSITAPAENIDLLVALTEETIAIHRGAMADGGIIVADSEYTAATKADIRVPFKEIADRRMENTAALGVVCALVGLDEDRVAALLEERFGKKGDDVVAENRTALRTAYSWALAQHAPHLKLPPIASLSNHFMMNGNEAIALGALAAGLKFYSFYPMTPSTSIGLALAAHARRMGIVVEQAEDEIAAINMAIGASFAGVPAMVATSGGGFALMVEGVSLAAMIETPVVVVVGQRPGPATGLPTRTEQADLAFVLHAGHGEFPRAIFAPGTVEECFRLTHKAFHCAEAAQGPMFVLTDQFLADSYRAIDPFDLDDTPPVRPGVDHAKLKAPYQRYAPATDGVSPRALPGLSEHLVVVDSDEHTRDGHLTEDLGARVEMVHKRLQKIDVIMREIVPPHRAGDDTPDVLFVSWGSTYGSVAEAIERLRERGMKTAMLHFSQVWPLKPAQCAKEFETARRVVAVEGNATGQFAALIRQETGFEIREKILRYDGLPITPEYIVKHICQQGICR